MSKYKQVIVPDRFSPKSHHSHLCLENSGHNHGLRLQTRLSTFPANTSSDTTYTKCTTRTGVGSGGYAGDV